MHFVVVVNNKGMKEFLQSVKGKFSDVLIPAENITKQDFLGKGRHFLPVLL